jgi:hypothetical protein
LFVSFHNNLFRGGFFPLSELLQGGAPVQWQVQDNLFDKANLSGSSVGIQYILCSNNGFTAGTINYLGGTNNKMNLIADYQAGPLGNYYYPSSGTNLFSLVDAGSTTADQVGLSNYTTQTNQVPEGNSVVDIGFHYLGN